MDFMNLTLAELKTLEDISSTPLGSLMTKLGSGDYTADMLKGLSVVLNRRTDPDFSVDDANEVSLSEALAFLSNELDGDDTGKD